MPAAGIRALPTVEPLTKTHLANQRLLRSSWPVVYSGRYSAGVCWRGGSGVPDVLPPRPGADGLRADYARDSPSARSSLQEKEWRGIHTDHKDEACQLCLTFCRRNDTRDYCPFEKQTQQDGCCSSPFLPYCGEPHTAEPDIRGCGTPIRTTILLNHLETI